MTVKRKQKHSQIDKAVDLLMDSGEDLSSVLHQGGLMSQLKKKMIERLLSEELNHHLGYAKHERNPSDNSRNGISSKEIITEDGRLVIDVPRDRESSFDPILIPKRTTRIVGLDEKIISLYAKGMSVRDIQEQLKELYGGAEISTGLISQITDGILEDVKAWQNRPLESVYPIVFFDCIVVNVRMEKRIIKKAIYVALGITMSGKKEILGLWCSENEGAKFWLNVFTELKNRGLQDILIACTDNLSGMSESILAAYPKTDHQLCIVHQIRNSLKYVSYKDRKAVCADLKKIYTAVNEDEAMTFLQEFEGKWQSRYPYIAKSWYDNWQNLVIFLEYPQEIRRIIYTTNAIESLNSQLRKVTKNKKIFPSDEAVFKLFYLAIGYVTKKWSMPVRNWSEAISHFMVKFNDRIGNLHT